MTLYTVETSPLGDCWRSHKGQSEDEVAAFMNATGNPWSFKSADEFDAGVAALPKVTI